MIYLEIRMTSAFDTCVTRTPLTIILIINDVISRLIGPFKSALIYTKRNANHPWDHEESNQNSRVKNQSWPIQSSIRRQTR